MTTSLAANTNHNRIARTAPYIGLQGLLQFDPFQSLRSNWAFDYDVSRTETGYEVEVPVPGYRSDQIEITFEDAVLSVTGKSERRTFSRSFSVPDDVDRDEISAHVNDGMLVLSLKRRPESQPKRIAVNESHTSDG